MNQIIKTNNGTIRFKSFLSLQGNDDLILFNMVCEDNNISFQPYEMPEGLYHSGLLSLISVILDNDILQGFMCGLSVNFFYDFIMKQFSKLKKNEKIILEHYKNFALLEIRSEKATLRIEAPALNDETLDKAFKTFLEVSQNPNTSNNSLMPTVVVIKENNDVEIMTAINYVHTYVQPNKEQTNNDQTQNANA